WPWLSGRPRDRSERAEVAVVAGGFEGGSERGVDEPVRLAGDIERNRERVGEERGGGDEAARGAIDAVQLAPCLEAAEDLVALPEEPLDGPQLRRGRAADDDLAAHRLEPPLGHETEVAASG